MKIQVGALTFALLLVLALYFVIKGYLVTASVFFVAAVIVLGKVGNTGDNS